MEREHYRIYDQIVEGWEDIAAGRVIEGSGDFMTDMKRFGEKEAKGWASISRRDFENRV